MGMLADIYRKSGKDYRDFVSDKLIFLFVLWKILIIVGMFSSFLFSGII